jgi:iron complex transport system substrate-binding protein
LGDIAASVGYDDPFYLSRIFKKHLGLSPSGYRREYGR